jgi:hypothetical protein
MLISNQQPSMTRIGNALAAKLGNGIIEPSEDSTEELARAVQNPEASLYACIN